MTIFWREYAFFSAFVRLLACNEDRGLYDFYCFFEPLKVGPNSLILIITAIYAHQPVLPHSQVISISLGIFFACQREDKN